MQNFKIKNYSKKFPSQHSCAAVYLFPTFTTLCVVIFIERRWVCVVRSKQPRKAENSTVLWIHCNCDQRGDRKAIRWCTL